MNDEWSAVEKKTLIQCTNGLTENYKTGFYSIRNACAIQKWRTKIATRESIKNQKKKNNGKGIPMQISMSLPWNSHLSPKIFSNQSNVKSSNKSKATHGKPWQKKKCKSCAHWIHVSNQFQNWSIWNENLMFDRYTNNCRQMRMKTFIHKFFFPNHCLCCYIQVNKNKNNKHGTFVCFFLWRVENKIRGNANKILRSVSMWWINERVYYI